MEHAGLIFVFRLPKGILFLMDFDSTHGTFWNKKRLKKKHYCRVSSGDFIRFGGSTRDYIFACPTISETSQTEETLSFCESGCDWYFADLFFSFLCNVHVQFPIILALKGRLLCHQRQYCGYRIESFLLIHTLSLSLSFSIC
jgi:hypothetical protein